MRIRNTIVLIVVALAALAMPFPSFAQTAGSPEETRKKADQLFENEDYTAAMPLYSGLLANNKEDANLNYRYGVCVLYASSQKDKALPFLEKASKSAGVDPDVWFFLGRAYHLNYQFDQAISAYNKYKTVGNPKKTEQMQLDNQIAMCKSGRKLLKAITDISVLDKAELSRADFFRRYDLKSAGYSGQLLVKPDDFKTALDKKKKESSIIFLSGEKNELYFSSYGNEETNGKDIFVVRKLPNGNWGKPFNLGYPVNTEYDEDYPFLHPNGKVLYFSSKGHKSMGGYDIFRSELNEETNTWQSPVNLDFAINSPDDDILFVSDFEEKTAWFASNRNSPDGRMTVYHVVIERKPVNMCLLSGNFKSTNGDPNLSAKITVKNAETNEPVGVYKSNEKTGAYFINLPNNGGKYTFTVEHSGLHTQTQPVFIPPQYEIKTVNQRIGYLDVNGDAQLFIETDFSSDSSVLDPEFLKDKAKLDIGSEPIASQVIDLDEPKNTNGNKTVANNTTTQNGGNEIPDDTAEAIDPSLNVPSSKNGVSNAELVKSAYEDADETQKEAVATRQESDRAYTYANDLNTQAKQATTKATEAKAQADGMTEGPEKTSALQKANELQAEANALQAQTVAALAIADALNGDAKQKEQEAAKANQYATALDKAVKSNDPKALDQATQLGTELLAMSESRSQSGETAKNLREEADKKKTQLENSQSELKDLKDEMASNEEKIKQLQADAAKEKDPDVKQGIEQQIEGLKEENAENAVALKKLQDKVNRLQNDFNETDNQAKAAENAIAQSKNPANAATGISPESKKALSSDALAYQQKIEDAGTVKNYAPASGGTQSGTEPVASNQNGTQNGSNQNGTQNSTQNGTQSGTQSGTEPVAVNENPDDLYQPQLNKAEQIKDPADREKAKADVYNNWAAAIDKQIKEKKDSLVVAKNKDDKARLKSEIQQLETESKAKKSDANASALAAQKIEQAALASNQNGTNSGKDSTQSGNQNGTEPVVLNSNPDAVFTEALANADTISNPAEKEKMKSAVYADWASNIDEQIKEKKDSLNIAKTKEDKARLKTEIQQLETDSKEKKSEANASTLAAQKYEQAALATNSGNAGKDSTQSVSANENPNDFYNQELSKTEKIADPADREKAKADVYNNWAAAIDNQIKEKKDSLAVAKNKDDKARLKTEIAQLETDSKEKKSEANESTLAAQKIEQAALATNAGNGGKDSTQSVSANENPNDFYNQELSKTEKIADPADREKAKADVYNNWAAAIDNQIKEKKDSLAVAKNKDDKARLKTEIAQLESDSKEKKSEANESTLAAQKIEQAALATNAGNAGKDSTQSVSANENPNDFYNQELSKTEKIADPADREKAKADVYNNWAAAIDNQIKEKKDSLAVAKNKDDKARLKTEIAQLETDSKEKKSEATASTLAAQKIEQAALATNSGNAGKDSTQSVSANENPNDFYNQELSKTEKIADPADREKAKADVYNNWAAAIDNQIKEKKDSLAVAKNKDDKARLKTEIAQLESDSKEKKSEANESTLAAQNIEKAAAEPGSTAALDKQFAADLNEASKQPNEEAKQNALAKLYTSWADSLDARAELKESEIAKTKNKQKQDQLKQEAAALRTDAENKRSLAAEAKQKADAAAIASQNAAVKQNTSATEVTYSSPQANAFLNEKAQLDEQAKAQRAVQDSLTREASNAQGTEKTQLLTQATNAQREAWRIDEQAANKQGEANKAQFNENASKLAAYNTAAAGNNDPSIASAQLLADEAQTLFEKASADRSAAAKATDNYTRNEYLRSAEENEQKAILKQQQALERYQQSGIQPANNGTQTVTQNNSQNANQNGSQNGTQSGTQNGTQNNSQNTNQNGSQNGTQSVTQNGTQNNSQNTNQNGSQNGTQAVTQNGTQNNSQNANQNGSQNGTQSVTQNGTQNNSQNTNQNGSQNGTQSVTQNGTQNNSQNANQNGSQNGTQSVTQNGTQNNSQNANQNGSQNGTQSVAQNGTQNNSQNGTQNSSSVASRLAPGEKFSVGTQSGSAAPVIEANPTLPEGLVFKVQIGAFRNPIPTELFKNIQPVTSESTPSGLTRYTAGFFTQFPNADAAKNEIRRMGYPDAFVVAYYNGKRISIAEAMRMSGGNYASNSGTQNSGTQSSNSGTQSSNNSGTQSSNSGTQNSGTQPSNSGTQSNAGTQSGSSSTAAKAPATDVKNVQGLFYTVQVGVFSREVSSAKLYNLTGLFSERTANGYYRYSTGKYGDLNAAVNAKNEIVNTGIKDAFVTAYYNGKRISVEEAKALEAQGVKAEGSSSGSAPQGSQNSGTQNSSAQNSGTQNSSSQNAGTQNNASQNSGTQNSNSQNSGTQNSASQNSGTQQASTQNSGTQQNNSMVSTKPPVPDTGIVFAVQLGAFREEVPVEIATKFLQFASRGVKPYFDTNTGLTVYLVGVLNSHDDAETLRDEAVSKGITDAFIVAFKDGKKIPMEEALKGN